MGNNVSNNFNFGTLFRNWTKYCMSCSAIPFMAQTLMQVGPPGWMLNNFATSVWPSTNMGPVGDWLQVGNSKNGSATKFNQLESILKDYAATLNDAEKTVLENKLKEFEDLKSSEKTQEKYEELLEIYDDYKGKIKESKLTDKGLGKADLKALENLTLENIQALVPDNDVADIVNAWNSNSNTKGTNLVATLQEKIKNGTETEKASAKAVLDKLYEKLKNKAILFEDDTNLSDKSNKALEKAIDDFDAFDSSRYTSAEYVKAFDNLYMATRLAEAEIAQKELKEEFKFLGEDSPFAEADFVSETQRDLRTEGLRKAQSVTIPEEDDNGGGNGGNNGGVNGGVNGGGNGGVNGGNPANGTKSIKINNTEYEVIDENNTRKYKNKTTGDVLTETEFFNQTNVTDVVINNDGSYTYKAGGVKYKGTPDHVVSRDI